MLQKVYNHIKTKTKTKTLVGGRGKDLVKRQHWHTGKANTHSETARSGCCAHSLHSLCALESNQKVIYIFYIHHSEYIRNAVEGDMVVRMKELAKSEGQSTR